MCGSCTSARWRRTGGSRRYSTGMVVSRATAGVVALTLVCASLFIYVKYREFWDSIKRVDVSLVSSPLVATPRQLTPY